MSIPVQRFLLGETLLSGEFYEVWSMQAIPIIDRPWCVRSSYLPSSYVSHIFSRVLQKALKPNNCQKLHPSAKSKLSLKPGLMDILHASRSISTSTYTKLY